METKRIIFNVSEELHEQAMKTAKLNAHNLSEILRQMLTSYIVVNGDLSKVEYLKEVDDE